LVANMGNCFSSVWPTATKYIVQRLNMEGVELIATIISAGGSAGGAVWVALRGIRRDINRLRENIGKLWERIDKIDDDIKDLSKRYEALAVYLKTKFRNARDILEDS